MQFKATLLNISAWQSKTKADSRGYYYGLSVNGRAKRQFARVRPEGVELIPSAQGQAMEVPKAGAVEVVVEFELGGFGEALGIDVVSVKKA